MDGGVEVAEGLSFIDVEYTGNGENSSDISSVIESLGAEEVGEFCFEGLDISEFGNDLEKLVDYFWWELEESWLLLLLLILLVIIVSKFTFEETYAIFADLLFEGEYETECEEYLEIEGHLILSIFKILEKLRDEIETGHFSFISGSFEDFSEVFEDVTFGVSLVGKVC